MAALTATASRFRANAAVGVSRAAATAARRLSTTPRPHNHPPRRDNAADKELYLSVLTSTSTTREARSYLKRFSPAPAILKYLKQSAFTQPGAAPPHRSDDIELHVGIVKIRDTSAIDAPTLHGIGRTLTQLTRLGLHTAVIIDEPPPPTSPSTSPTPGEWRALVEAQSDRVVAAIEASGGRARRVDGCATTTTTTTTTTTNTNDVEISTPELLLAPLARGVIPVLPPLAMTAAHRLAPTTGDALLLSLAALLPQRQHLALDRLILLDPLGGIPSHDRPAGAHVFINLAQEHATIAAHLPTPSPHTTNLHTLRTALSALPATTSALITTPSLASAPSPRARNPLIHNLLTDKPLTSSSLPVQAHTRAGTLTTLVKRGIPLAVRVATQLDDPAVDLPALVALVEDSFGKRLDLQHYLARVQGRVAALVVAGDYEGAAIVTWEYPGDAGDEGVGGEGGRGKGRGRRVLYLDKFAVLKRSQGTGGVADIVFKGMVEAVRSGALDAEGIVWRSRRWNPVNKWYFERAKGTYKIPDSGWTMFWTSRDGDEAVGVERFVEYERVCRGIVPSLVDE